MNSCPPPPLYLSLFQPYPHSLTSKIFVYFPFFLSPPYKGTNSLLIYQTPCHFQPLLGAHPFTNSTQSNIEVSCQILCWEKHRKEMQMCQALPGSLPSSPLFLGVEALNQSPSVPSLAHFLVGLHPPLRAGVK